MTIHRHGENPLDATLRDRLHLKGDATIPLWLIRTAMQTIDGLSRALAKHPFFALRESEALLAQLDGLHGSDLLSGLMQQNGGTEIIPHGIENIPANGPVIIAATHPTGLFDFVAHAGALLRKRPDLRVVANQETERFLGSDMVIPVHIDKQNRAKSATRTRRAMQAFLDSGGAMLIFGSGRVPKMRDGKLVEPDWRHGTSQVSQACAAPIVPAALAAKNGQSYYRVRSLAQRISGGSDSFGAMIASLRYSAELLNKLGGRFHVHYGEMLPPGTSTERIQSAAEALVPGLYSSAGPSVRDGLIAVDQSSKSSG